MNVMNVDVREPFQLTWDQRTHTGTQAERTSDVARDGFLCRESGEWRGVREASDGIRFSSNGKGAGLSDDLAMRTSLALSLLHHDAFRDTGFFFNCTTCSFKTNVFINY